MRLHRFGLFVCLASGAAACTSPVSPVGTVTVSTASPASPANGAEIANAQQPVTLVAKNAFVTDGAAVVGYTFEVATDAAFATKVATKDVSQTPGQTVLKLDTLPAGRDYFWHVRATANDTVGSFSSALKFTIGPALIVGAPTLAGPTNGSSSYGWPTLVVDNAPRTGPTTSMVYKFDIATSSTFSTLVLSATVPETATRTSFLPTQALPAQDTTYFWRVMATDTITGISGPTSATQSFVVTTVVPSPFWPGEVPPGAPGHARKGDNWQEQDLVSHGGVPFHSPTLEMNRLFDILDRGFAPQAGIDWMNSHGYPTIAAWFPGVQVIGVNYVYLALIGGRWDIILRGEGD